MRGARRRRRSAAVYGTRRSSWSVTARASRPGRARHGSAGRACPRSCSAPRPGRGRARARRPRPPARTPSTASAATAREWPSDPRRLEVGEVGEHEQRLVRVVVGRAAGTAGAAAARRPTGRPARPLPTSRRPRPSDEIGQLGVVGLAAPAPDDRSRAGRCPRCGRGPRAPGASCAMRIGRGIAVPFAPVGSPRPFQRSKLAASAARTASSRPSRIANSVGDLAGGAEVHLRGLLAAREHRRARTRSRLTPERPGPAWLTISRIMSNGLAKSSCSDSARISISSPNTTAMSKAWPVQPRNRSAEVHHVVARSRSSAPAASARCWPSTVARSCDPAGWAKAWSWATASSAAISTPCHPACHGYHRRWGVLPMRRTPRGASWVHDATPRTPSPTPRSMPSSGCTRPSAAATSTRVLAELADDVDWAAEAAGTAVPWCGSFRGQAEVPRILRGDRHERRHHRVRARLVHVERHRRRRDRPLDLHGARDRQDRGDVHAALVALRDDGKIVFFRGSEDTAQSPEAFS